MALHVSFSGDGPVLVLLHGWGLNSHVWDSIVPRLSGSATVMRIDLPGHGSSEWGEGFRDLNDLASVVARQVPDGAIVLGWSLGAQIALRMTIADPERVRALILVAATPRFVRAPDWKYGMEPAVLQSFGERLLSDFRATVKEFLALQVRGDERAQATLRFLRNEVLAAGEPDVRALQAGLELLRTVDLREPLARVRAPALVIAGERDRLTPPEASQELAALLPRARFVSMPGAAHAPFLSHADEFLREVTGFLSRTAASTRAEHPPQPLRTAN